MNELNQKKSRGTIVIIILLVIALCGMGGYLVYDKVLSPQEETSQEEDNRDETVGEEEGTDSSQSTENSSYQATFRGNQAINTSGLTYQLFDSVEGINVTLDASQREVTFSYNSNKIEGSKLTEEQTETIFDTSSFIVIFTPCFTVQKSTSFCSKPTSIISEGLIPRQSLISSLNLLTCTSASYNSFLILQSIIILDLTLVQLYNPP